METYDWTPYNWTPDLWVEQLEVIISAAHIELEELKPEIFRYTQDNRKRFKNMSSWRVHEIVADYINHLVGERYGSL
jgi:predicted metal-dependent RNase